MRSKRVDSVNSGLKHIKKCQKGSRPPPMALKYNEKFLFLPGPVFVEFPIDSLYPYHMVEKEVTGSNGPGRAVVSRISKELID